MRWSVPFRWLAYSVGSLVADVVGLLLVPFFAIHPKLFPKWAWNIWGNDDGDILYYEDQKDNVWLMSYWERVYWLAWRNKAHNLSRRLGVSVQPYKKWGDAHVSDLGYEGLWVVWQDNAFEVYWVKRWFKSGYCIRVRIGWKLHGMLPEQTAMLVYHISPLHSFKRPIT